MTDHLLLGAGTGAVVALVIWFVVIPLGLRGVFDALGVSRSRAWVPFVNLATVYRLGGLSEYWLIVLVVPPATVLGAIMLFVASHRITRLLGRSGWFTVLAVVQWWLWALAVGLRRVRKSAADSEPLVWSVRRPETALRLPSDDDATPSASSPLIDPVIVRPPHLETPAADPAPPAGPHFPPPQPPTVQTPPTVQAPPTVQTPPAAQPTVPVQRLHLPIETTPAPAAEPELPSFPPADADRRDAPSLETPTDEASVPELPQFEPDDDATILSRGSLDQTVISSRRRPLWAVHTTMGNRIELVGTSAILGRRPRAHPLYPGAQLIMVTDDATSVSAVHAALEYLDDDWHVTDLGSTNGVWLVDPTTGEERELGAHTRRRVTPQFLLGELGVRVVRNV